jgi:hypothetical protein
MSGAAALDREQDHDDHQRRRHHRVRQSGAEQLEALDSAQHGNRGRDQGVAIEERSPHDRQSDDRAAPARSLLEPLLHQRKQ